MRVLSSLTLVSLFLFMSACDVADTLQSSSEPVNSRFTETAEKGGPPPTGNTIVDIASANDDFSILVDAVVFAGLADDLSGRRQFTVFAPTNDAFASLLEDLGISAEELFVDENRSLVRDILLYHVAPGKRAAESVITSDRIRTISKSFIFVQEENGDFFVGNDNGYARIIATDIFASNGVIHVIDHVMLP
jgi:transforming growth factor-beta-induced protein